MRLAAAALLAVVWTSTMAVADDAAPAPAMRVVLDSGDVLIGRVVERTDAGVTVEHELLGRVTLPAERVVSVESAEANAQAVKEEVPAPPTPAKTEPVRDAAAEASVIADAKKRSWLDPWDIELSLGFNVREAQADSMDINAAVVGRFADERDRWRIGAAYFLSSTDGERRRSDLRAELQKDWLLPGSPWFVFFQGEYAHDDFKSWEHRISAHGGMGYDLKGIGGLDANLRAGAGVTHEWGGTDPSTTPESLLGSEVAFRIADGHTLAASAQWYPAIDGSGDFRLVTTGSWTIRLTELLGLRIGARNEYDSSEPKGYERNDLHVFGSLVFKF